MQMDAIEKEFSALQLFGHASSLKANYFKDYVENFVNKAVAKIDHL